MRVPGSCRVVPSQSWTRPGRVVPPQLRTRPGRVVSPQLRTRPGRVVPPQSWTRPGRDPGFALIDVAAAMAVITVVAIVVMQAVVSARNAARATEELRLASALAQGGFERVRSLPPDESPLPAGSRLKGKLDLHRDIPLQDAALDLEVLPWRGDPGLKHVRVTLKWRSCRGGQREVVREGLISDARLR